MPNLNVNTPKWPFSGVCPRGYFTVNLCQIQKVLDKNPKPWIIQHEWNDNTFEINHSYKVKGYVVKLLNIVVKLHSALRILTQLQLVGLEVDFVFPLEEGMKEEERRKNPHLAFSRRNDPTCLNFSDCIVGVWRVYGNCLESVWRVSGRCPFAVWRVS